MKTIESITLKIACDRLRAHSKKYPGRCFHANEIAAVLWPERDFRSQQGAGGAVSRILKKLGCSHVSNLHVRGWRLGVPPLLTHAEKEAMLRVKNGADVSDYLLAGKLRAIQKSYPHLISIGETRAREYSPHERLPYFGAILTDAGRVAVLCS